MKVDLIAVALALCLAAGPAIAQQSTTPSGVSSTGGSRLLRPCSALGATSDCSIDLPLRRPGAGTLTGPSNNLTNEAGSGLGSTFPATGPLGGPGDVLSRGISGGTVGSGVDPLGIDSSALLRSMSSGSPSGSLGGRSSLSGLGAAGPLGRSSELGSGSGSRLR